jgi:lactate 2-monooxygenase
MDRQQKIYLDGVAGKRPVIPVSFDKLEEKAKSVMSPEAFAYIAGGAGSENTIRTNTQSFDEYKIIPRVLRDVSARDTSLELFGSKISSPIVLSPIGVLEMAHREADKAVGRAAAELKLPFIFSNQASFAMEHVASQMGSSPHWFQLYWSKSRDLVVSFVERAEKCGCSAIVLTLDTTLLGWRSRDLELGYLPFLEGKGIAQYTSDPVFQQLMDDPEGTEPIKKQLTWSTLSTLMTMVNRYPGGNFFSKLKSGRPIKAVRKFVSIYSNPSVTWQDLSFLRDHTKLPIVLKGILHAEDARKAIDAGMDGIIVSNHGGRQIDGAISTLEALPEISKAVNKKIPVLLDSGIRSGPDVFKALALGATAVGVGRPYAYGLSIAGQSGVEEVMRNITTEFDLTMGLAGCKNLGEITRDSLCR